MLNLVGWQLHSDTIQFLLTKHSSAHSARQQGRCAPAPPSQGFGVALLAVLGPSGVTLLVLAPPPCRSHGFGGAARPVRSWCRVKQLVIMLQGKCEHRKTPPLKQVSDGY